MQRDAAGEVRNSSMGQIGDIIEEVFGTRKSRDENQKEVPILPLRSDYNKNAACRNRNAKQNFFRLTFTKTSQAGEGREHRKEMLAIIPGNGESCILQ